MVETVVIMFATLLLLFGIIQFGLIYNAKTVLNYATFEAARAGSLNHGSPEAMRTALVRVLSAMKMPKGSDPDFRKYQAAQESMREDKETRICMERINPPLETDLWEKAEIDEDEDEDEDPGYQNFIPNDWLRYRKPDKKQSENEITIQDANLLKIRVTYCHEIIVPFVATTLRRLMLGERDPDPLKNWTTPSLGSFTKQCWAHDQIPIESSAIMRMQTEIRDYPFDEDCS